MTDSRSRWVLSLLFVLGIIQGLQLLTGFESWDVKLDTESTPADVYVEHSYWWGFDRTLYPLRQDLNGWQYWSGGDWSNVSGRIDDPEILLDLSGPKVTVHGPAEPRYETLAYENEQLERILLRYQVPTRERALLKFSLDNPDPILTALPLSRQEIAEIRHQVQLVYEAANREGVFRRSGNASAANP